MGRKFSLLMMLLLLVALTLCLAGCGDDDDDDDDNDSGGAGDDDDDDDDDDNDDDDDDDNDDDNDDDDDDDNDNDDDDDSTPSTEDCEPYGYGDAPTIVRGPYLQHVTKHTQRIMWWTDVPANTVVRFGNTEDLGFFQCDLEESEKHEIEVTGLDTESAYYYMVRSNGAQSDKHTFVTAPETESPFTFTVLGDSRSDPVSHEAVVDGMIDADPDFVFNVGDIVGDGWIQSQYDPMFFTPGADLMAEKATYVSIGNHEGEATFFYNYLSLPGDEKYFSYEWGNAIFISLNTNRLYLQGTPQYVWFESELQRAQDEGFEWIFVFAHHPAYSEGWDSPGYTGELLMRFSLVPLMEQYDVDVFFCGHTHDYERGDLNGVIHIITGGGGAALDSFQQDFEHITVYETRYHFVNAAIAGNTATFNATDPDGTVFDTFEITH